MCCHLQKTKRYIFPNNLHRQAVIFWESKFRKNWITRSISIVVKKYFNVTDDPDKADYALGIYQQSGFAGRL